MTAFKSDFLNVLQERGFIHQCSDFDGLDALAAKGEAIAYVGYDCTAPSLHIGNYLTMMMLHWLQQSGNKPITLMGGGTTMVGDPSGKDETRAHAQPIEEIEANKACIRGVFAKVLRYGYGAQRRDHARQRRMADQAELDRDAARHRPAFLGQPHADDGLGAAAARTRAGDELHRVQLHGLPGLRLRRAVAAHRLPAADGRLGPMGQHRQRRRSRPPHGHAAIVRADDAAAHHRLRRQDGQDRARARSGSTPTSSVPYDFWQYWRNTEDADVVKFLKLFTILPMGEIDRLAALAGRRDQRGQEGAGGRRDRAAARRARPRASPPKPRGRPSRKARSPKTCRRSKFRAANSKPASACWRCSSRPASSHRTARRAARSRAAACASTTSRSPTRR